MSIIDILLVILIIIASILGLYLIKLVKRLFITIEIVESKVKELDEKITPLLTDARQMAEVGSSVANIAKENIANFESVLAKIKSRLGAFIPGNSETNLPSPQENAKNIVTNMKAVFKGFSTFINELKK